MDEINRLLSDNLAIVVGALLAVLLVLLIVAIVQSVRLGRAVRDYRALLGDGGNAAGGNLGEVLQTHIAHVDSVAGRLEQLNGLHRELERRTAASIQHVGLVRYNPFEDTGSDQSFAIALLDGDRDGVVISSLHGRANTRIFAKPVEAGASRMALSDEEEQAIRIAVSGTGPDRAGD